jgi:hypothetical protein
MRTGQRIRGLRAGDIRIGLVIPTVPIFSPDGWLLSLPFITEISCSRHLPAPSVACVMPCPTSESAVRRSQTNAPALVPSAVHSRHGVAMR